MPVRFLADAAEGPGPSPSCGFGRGGVRGGGEWGHVGNYYFGLVYFKINQNEPYFLLLRMIKYICKKYLVKFLVTFLVKFANL